MAILRQIRFCFLREVSHAPKYTISYLDFRLFIFSRGDLKKNRIHFQLHTNFSELSQGNFNGKALQEKSIIARSGFHMIIYLFDFN